MTKQADITFGLGIDWETSGADFGKDSSLSYQGLSYGAVVFDAKTFQPVEKLYREIKFDETRYKWQDGAQRIHGLTREHLAANGVSRQDAAVDLASLILKYWGSDSKVMFLGHNPEFDRRFTNQLLNDIEIEFSVEKQTNFDSWIQLHHVMLDTSALGFVAFGLYKSDLLFKKIGFEDRAEHNALTDIEQTLATCAAVREIIQIALPSL